MSSSSMEQAAAAGAAASSKRSYQLTSVSPETLRAYQGGVFEELDSNFLSPRYIANKAYLDSQVVGQEAAKVALLRAIERAENPLRDRTRPISIIYFLGDSRVGKGLLVECGAFILHGNKERFLKLNGGSYKASFEASRLVGSAPGLVGFHDDGKGVPGKLSNASLQASKGASKCPTIILFIDEADLLHQSLDDVMMSIFDKGQLDMGNNQVTDFRNVIIILAGNLGLQDALVNRPGFGQNHSATKTHGELSEAITEAYTKRYTLPWRNRVDDKVIFEPHTPEQIDAIVQMELDKFKARMAEQLSTQQMFELSFDVMARRFIFESAMQSEGKVAEIKRLTQRLIIDKLGPQVTRLAGKFVIGTHKPGAKELTFVVAHKPDDGGGSRSPDLGSSRQVTASSSSGALTSVRSGGSVSVRTHHDEQTSGAVDQIALMFMFAFLVPLAMFGQRRQGV